MAGFEDLQTKLANYEEGSTSCPFCGSFKVVATAAKTCGAEKVITFFCADCRRKYSLTSRDVVPAEQKADELFRRPPEGNGERSWAAYNDSQTQEKLLFWELLGDISAFVPDTKRGCVGRPKADFREVVVGCVSKAYEGLSSRRANSDLEIAVKRGYLSKAWHFNTLHRCLNKPELTPLLRALIALSALPLAGFEETVAIDSSGLSSSQYSRWFDFRFGKDKRVRDWIKVNLCCGVKTNVVTAVTVTDGTAGDSPQFKQLLEETAQAFKPDAVVADKGYLSRQNLQTAWELGIVPFIPFKSNVTANKQGSQAWQKMLYYFRYNKERFMARYHARSNVESTFSMMKRKLGGRLYSKNKTAQVNEALCKVLCHNLIVLIHEAKQNGFALDLKQSAPKLPEVHLNALKNAI